MTHRCELCWSEFDTEEELAAHIEIEQALTYSVDGEGYEDAGDSPPTSDQPSTNADTI